VVDVLACSFALGSSIQLHDDVPKASIVFIDRCNE